MSRYRQALNAGHYADAIRILERRERIRERAVIAGSGISWALVIIVWSTLITAILP